jgi:peptidyl-prolyl cis-trans isomerase A (cyclophilin A)
MLVALITITSLFLAVSLVVAQTNEKLMNPEQLKETAPDKYKVSFDTSKGEFIIEVIRSFSPNGADRFYNLVKNGYYDNCKFFRVVPNFMVQFGMNGDPNINRVWSEAKFPDDKTKISNFKGNITFATSGPNSRTAQVFINLKDNDFLDKDFAPFGRVVKGMKVVESLYKEYGDAPPKGKGPEQANIRTQGNAYLEKNFPNLDYIKTATIVQEK